MAMNKNLLIDSESTGSKELSDYAGDGLDDQVRQLDVLIDRAREGADKIKRDRSPGLSAAGKTKLLRALADKADLELRQLTGEGRREFVRGVAASRDSAGMDTPVPSKGLSPSRLQAIRADLIDRNTRSQGLGLAEVQSAASAGDETVMAAVESAPPLQRERMGIASEDQLRDLRRRFLIATEPKAVARLDVVEAALSHYDYNAASARRIVEKILSVHATAPR